MASIHATYLCAARILEVIAESIIVSSACLLFEFRCRYCSAVRTVQYSTVQYSTAGCKMQLAGLQFSSRLVTADCHVARTVTTSNDAIFRGEIKSAVKFGG